MPKIHPTSVIEPGAQLASSVEIGPFCHIGGQAKIGAGTKLLSHVVIAGHTTLGAGNLVFPQAVLGGKPQDLKYRGEDTQLVIGDNNEIRESVTMNVGTENGGSFTRVGNDNLIMAYVHIGHDCILGSHCIVANAVQLAGHIHIDDHANIGGATAIHHYVTIGLYAFVGGMTRVVQDAPPFTIVEGNPARVRGINVIGLTRHRFPQATIDRLKDAYRLLYHRAADTNGEAGLTMADNLNRLAGTHPDDECITTLVTFIRNSSIGLHGRYRESTRKDNRFQNPTR